MRRILNGIPWDDSVTIVSSLFDADSYSPAYEESGIAFQRHSDTSIEAAQSMRQHAPTLRERVLKVFRAYAMAGLTDENLVEIMQLPANTVRPRRIELVRLGLLEECGQRKTKSGRNAVVWRIKMEAMT